MKKLYITSVICILLFTLIFLYFNFSFYNELKTVPAGTVIVLSPIKTENILKVKVTKKKSDIKLKKPLQMTLEESMQNIFPEDKSYKLNNIPILTVTKPHQKEIPDYSSLVESELRKLSPGIVLFNAPQQMKVGIKDGVEVRISKNMSKELTDNLKIAGFSRIDTIKVSTLMQVRLIGDNFVIESLSDSNQIVSDNDYTQWQWNVTPTKSGEQTLLLSVAAVITISQYGCEKKDYPVFEKKLNVDVNPVYTVHNFFVNYWQWIISTLIIPFIIWFVKNKFNKIRR